MIAEASPALAKGSPPCRTRPARALAHPNRSSAISPRPRGCQAGGAPVAAGAIWSPTLLAVAKPRYAGARTYELLAWERDHTDPAPVILLWPDFECSTDPVSLRLSSGHIDPNIAKYGKRLGGLAPAAVK